MLHGEPTTDSSPTTSSSPTPAVASVPTFCSIAFISDEKGRGVVATSVIPVHTVIGDYSGEQITEAVKDRRYLKSREAEREAHDLKWLASRLERGQGVSGDYLFGVSGVDAFIDAEDEHFSNWTRFLNHSDDPNVNVKSLPVGMSGSPRVWFVASRDISPGEEICFSYGDDYWRDEDEFEPV
ncbi:hypothetical protein TrLO_g534 [Triparma laevis f. longispina]|uniref:SET domain-containing protein n=1 Tax=Triparma laevis f. longispina TaxID=1714387 RepID=A0A9W7FIV5_9STRA|nr:hypothetical protein TrLO_g534 [Triparma laevis f. longispina]